MISTSGKTVRLTTAQAVVKFLAAQYSVADGQRARLIPAALGIFGHGNVAGLGQALDELSDELPFIQGRHEQYLAHIAVAYGKATRRRSTLAVTASIGPGALNLVTVAGSGDVEPVAGAVVARRHLRHPASGPGAAAAGTPHRGRRHRQRRVPAGVAVL